MGPQHMEGRRLLLAFARVSTRAQKRNLDRQIEEALPYIRSEMPGEPHWTDMNWMPRQLLDGDVLGRDGCDVRAIGTVVNGNRPISRRKDLRKLLDCCCSYPAGGVVFIRNCSRLARSFEAAQDALAQLAALGFRVYAFDGEERGEVTIKSHARYFHLAEIEHLDRCAHPERYASRSRYRDRKSRAWRLRRTPSIDSFTHERLKQIRREGNTFELTAERLNDEGHKTPLSLPFKASTVGTYWRRPTVREARAGLVRCIVRLLEFDGLGTKGSPGFGLQRDEKGISFLGAHVAQVTAILRHYDAGLSRSAIVAELRAGADHGVTQAANLPSRSAVHRLLKQFRLAPGRPTDLAKDLAQFARVHFSVPDLTGAERSD